MAQAMGAMASGAAGALGPVISDGAKNESVQASMADVSHVAELQLLLVFLEYGRDSMI